MTILIITHSQDNESIPLVMDAIAQQGGTAFRFDTDRFPTEIQLEIYYSQQSQQVILTTEQDRLNLSEVSAIWYRRIGVGGRIPTSMNAQLRHASVQESRATLQGMIASHKAFHLDPVGQIRRAENKQLQLQVARELGIEIPRTLITNQPQAVQEFATDCEHGLMTKMLSSFAIYEEGQEKVVFTNPVPPEALHDLDGLRFCPMTFQENIPKALELRTIIVGQQVFTAAIDSQQQEGARHDWRRRGVALLDAWQHYVLPQAIEEKLLKLMAHFQLNYGALDLILTPAGRHVFLEVNPVGEFFWLERCPGLPISAAIADLLRRNGDL
jgi:MvdD family ATP-grasp ribosomal peptide maturase